MNQIKLKKPYAYLYQPNSAVEDYMLSIKVPLEQLYDQIDYVLSAYNGSQVRNVAVYLTKIGQQNPLYVVHRAPLPITRVTAPTAELFIMIEVFERTSVTDPNPVLLSQYKLGFSLADKGQSVALRKPHMYLREHNIDHYELYGLIETSEFYRIDNPPNLFEVVPNNANSQPLDYEVHLVHDPNGGHVQLKYGRHDYQTSNNNTVVNVSLKENGNSSGKGSVRHDLADPMDLKDIIELD